MYDKYYIKLQSFIIDNYMVDFAGVNYTFSIFRNTH